mgnify:CR=1 FL=1
MGDVIDDRPLILVAEDNASNYLLIEILLKHTYRLFPKPSSSAYFDGYQDARNEWV